MSSPTLRSLLQLPSDPAPLSKSALILIDCQNTYREGIMQLEGVEPALAECSRLLARARPRSTEPEIFVSYSHADEPFARRLVTDLKKRKFNVWLDVFDIQSGASWARQIGEALDTCRLMLLILSPDSMVSENVEDEWNYYLDKQKMIVPVLYRPCDIPYRLHKLHYIDFDESAYDEALARLVTDLQARLA